MKDVLVKYVLSHKNAKAPCKQYDGDAAYDLYAASISFHPEQRYIEYDTGVVLEIPKNFVGKIYPRSSVRKTGLQLVNSVGIIDSGYRGTIKITFLYTPGLPIYNVGDRIAQLLIEPVFNIDFKHVTIDELTPTDRGTRGHGSSGK